VYFLVELLSVTGWVFFMVFTTLTKGEVSVIGRMLKLATLTETLIIPDSIRTGFHNDSLVKNGFHLSVEKLLGFALIRFTIGSRNLIVPLFHPIKSKTTRFPALRVSVF